MAFEKLAFPGLLDYWIGFIYKIRVGAFFPNFWKVPLQLERFLSLEFLLLLIEWSKVGSFVSLLPSCSTRVSLYSFWWHKRSDLSGWLDTKQLNTQSILPRQTMQGDEPRWLIGNAKHDTKGYHCDYRRREPSLINGLFSNWRWLSTWG